MSLFISFEGGEAVGKSLQSKLLRDRLIEAGLKCILVQEPGGTPLGEHLRPMIKGEIPLTYEAELFLFSAARSQLVSTVIRPALEAKTIVIADRYVDSTTTYQGYGRRLNLDQVKIINALSTQGIMPSFTVLLDIDPEQALARRASQLKWSEDLTRIEVPSRLDSEGQSKFENAPIKFHQRVREGYLKLAREEPGRWLVVDACQPPDKIQQVIWAKVQPLLPIKSGNR